MYAVFKTGGKQYKVSEGDILRVEKLPGEVGDEITLEDVLLVKDGEALNIGKPTLDSASVKAKITSQDKHRKIVVLHKKRRKSFRKKTGHRQPFTELTITGISL